MKKILSNGNGHRIAGASIGLLAANLIVSILTDQLGLPLHPNVVASGSLLIAAIINKLMSKYFN
jgi:hypothetical protein